MVSTHVLARTRASRKGAVTVLQDICRDYLSIDSMMIHHSGLCLSPICFRLATMHGFARVQQCTEHSANNIGWHRPSRSLQLKPLARTRRHGEPHLSDFEIEMDVPREQNNHCCSALGQAAEQRHHTSDKTLKSVTCGPVFVRIVWSLPWSLTLLSFICLWLLTIPGPTSFGTLMLC